MKNKYQEALDKLSLEVKGLEENESIKILQELVKKETPKKPVYEGDFIDEDIQINIWAYCPTCKEELEHDRWGEKYCSYCGQKLDWSEIDE